ncbi:MAG: PfkB family carbohydrate kinase [Atopobiaceae bacterium]|jgi:sulfofructose kinase
MSIFCVGQAAYDITARVDEDIVPDRKYRLTTHTECPGAPSLNGACVCGKWGASSYLVARIGKDAYGTMIKDQVRSCGVNLDYLLDAPGVSTSFSFIIANGKTESRTIFNFPSQPVEAKVRFPEEAPDVILCDGHEPEATIAFSERFPQAAVVVDAGTCRESTMQTARVSDYIVSSKTFAERYTGKSLPKDDEGITEVLHALGEINPGCRVAVTLGSEGLVYLEDNELVRLPAFPADTIDSTGAGDIFHGAFAYGLSRGLSFVDCLTLGSMTASISTTKMGSQRSIPELEQVLDALEEHGSAIAGLR